MLFNKSVRIASYVRKPVKTMEIRKTHVKNVQIDTSDLDALRIKEMQFSSQVDIICIMTVWNQSS